jgi:type I restriction enzyme, S subunit
MKLPHGWKQVEIGSVASINQRSVPSNTNPAFRFRYLELSAVNQGRIVYPEDPLLFKTAPSRARRLVQCGDVLMSMVRPNLQGFARFDEAPGCRCLYRVCGHYSNGH